MMLELKNRPAPVEPMPMSEENELGKMSDIARLFLSRHYGVIIAIILASIVGAVVYLKFAQTIYTATTTIEIVNREGGFLQQQATVTDAPLDIQRDVTIIKSSTVAERVVKALHLDQDPEFNAAGEGVVANLKSLLKSFPKLQALLPEDNANPELLRLRSAVATVQSKMHVEGVGAGTALEVSFASADANKAADVANAIADTFIDIQNGADDEVRKKANSWLIGQSTEFRKRAEESEAAVSAFEKANNIVTVDGKPLDQQILKDVGERVSKAKTALIDAKYKLDKISSSTSDLNNKDILSVTSAPEILQDPIISKARDRYVDLANEVDSIQKNFGKDSQKLRDLMASAKADILAELPRLLESARNDYDLAQKHYDEQLAEQKADTESAQRASYLESQLKELQGTAENYRTLYGNFVQHSAGSIQEVSFPVRSTRISERATAPLDKTWPKNNIVLLLGLAGGLVLGVGAGVLRDLADRTMRTGDQLSAATDLKCIGMVPQSKITKSALRKAALPGDVLKRFYDLQNIPIWWKIKATPNSRFSAEMVSASLAVRAYMRSHGASVIAMTSAVPGEGKTTLVTSLGILLAQSGFSVALVDLDLHIPALSQALAAPGTPGLADFISGACSFDEAMFEDPDLSLSIMTAGSTIENIRPVELLTSIKLRECIARLRQKFDCVLIDLPPLVPVGDVRATFDFIDGYVLAVEWAKTDKALLGRAMDSYREIRSKFVGGILNKVNFKTLAKYDTIAPFYYSKTEYGRYRDND